jgi:hypothetical protein
LALALTSAPLVLAESHTVQIVNKSVLWYRFLFVRQADS